MPFSAIHPLEEVGEMADKIMHAELLVDGKKLFFAADIFPGMTRIKGEDTPFSLTGAPETEEELPRIWDKLTEGAQITMPREQVPWGAVYGALTDRFGTLWMFNIGG